MNIWLHLRRHYDPVAQTLHRGSFWKYFLTKRKIFFIGWFFICNFLVWWWCDFRIFKEIPQNIVKSYKTCDLGEKSRFLKKKQDFSTSCPSHIVTFFSELSRSASEKFLGVNFFIHNQLLRNFIADTFITLCMGGLLCDKQQKSKYTVYTVYTDVHSNTQGK